MHRWRSKLTSLLLAAVMVSAITGLAAAKGKDTAPAHGTVNPFSLAAQALMNKDSSTDLYLDVNTSDGAYPAPDTMQKVQLKSYTTDGELRYTRNFQNVAAPGGAAHLVLTDVERKQPLKVRVNAQTAQTVNMEVLETGTDVHLRPDLTVKEIKAPAQANVGVAFPVNVLVQELNGDVGATADVKILNGSAVLDQANGVSVAQGGAQAVGMMLQFDQPGTYTLTVDIANVAPGDYDTANNQATFAVEILSANQTVQYYSGYDYFEYRSNSDAYDAGASTPHSTYRYGESWENYWVDARTTDPVQLAGTYTITLTSETGATKTLNFTNVSLNQWTCDSANNACAYVHPYGSGTRMYAYSYAGEWFYSQNWYGWTGGYHSGYGTFLRAKQQVDALLDLPDQNGTRFGGRYSLPLWTWGSDWDYWYYYWWLNDNIHNWGHWRYWQGWGSGQTSW